MGIFEKIGGTGSGRNGIGRGLGGLGLPGGIVRSPFEPKLGEDDFKKIKTVLFTDAEVEGEKQGIEKASAHYLPILEKLEAEYVELKNNVKSSHFASKTISQILLAKLSSFEDKLEELKQQKNDLAKTLADEHKVPLSSVTQSMSAGKCFFALVPDYEISILDFIYDIKMKKIRKAMLKYYKNAVRDIWRPKVKRLNRKLTDLKNDAEQEIQESVKAIADTLLEISDIETQIAQAQAALAEE